MSARRTLSLVLTAGALIAYGISHLHDATAAPAMTTAVNSAGAQGEESLITEPDDGIAPIIALIQNASTSVDLVIYQLEDTDVERALAEAASRGVSVRVLLNLGYYGKKENTRNDSAYQFFSGHGVPVRWAPSYFALTHQKSIIIDRKKLVVMTLNLTPRYYASGREFALIDADSNDVSAAESAFSDDWDASHSPAGNGDSLIWSPGSENALLDLIASAQSSIDVYNEEMADGKITESLAAAASRGVVVRIVMTYESSWKKAFSTLSAAGAQVRTYSASAPLYIHAKMILTDGTRAFVGSENFSVNSLEKNRELGTLVTDTGVLTRLSHTFETDWTGAKTFSP